MVSGLKGELVGQWIDAQAMRFDVHGGVTSIDTKYSAAPAEALSVSADPGFNPPTNG